MHERHCRAQDKACIRPATWNLESSIAFAILSFASTLQLQVVFRHVPKSNDVPCEDCTAIIQLRLASCLCDPSLVHETAVTHAADGQAHWWITNASFQRLPALVKTQVMCFI